MDVDVESHFDLEIQLKSKLLVFTHVKLEFQGAIRVGGGEYDSRRRRRWNRIVTRGFDKGCQRVDRTTSMRRSSCRSGE